MDNARILVNHTEELTRVALLEGGLLTEIHLESARERRIVGNIYKGRVLKVLPGMNAAFVDAGLARTAFLYALDVRAERVREEDGEEEDALHPRREGGESEARIETLLREGQEVLVQVAKEPLGSKGARLTCNLSIPGVLAVLLPAVDQVGVSRRIEDAAERQRLREVGHAVKPEGMGLILRTIAEGRSEEEIRSEVELLHKLWLRVREAADACPPPALVHEEMRLLLRAARDLVCRKFDELIVDSPEGAREVDAFVRQFLPAFASKVKLYTGTEPLFERFGIDAEIARALQRKVWLRSGGTIVIDRTEALTVVDVNSGKFTGKDDPEETILRTNLEATKEIAYQLKLRNIGGIIVIDFIDMKSKESRQQVHEALVAELKHDFARTRVLPVSDLGLVEMTRKRVSESLVTRLTEPCFYCEGKGYLKTPEMVAHAVAAKIKKDIEITKARKIMVHASPKVVDALLESYEARLERLEKRFNKAIEIIPRENFHLEQYEVFGET